MSIRLLIYRLDINVNNNMNVLSNNINHVDKDKLKDVKLEFPNGFRSDSTDPLTVSVNWRFPFSDMPDYRHIRELKN